MLMSTRMGAQKKVLDFLAKDRSSNARNWFSILYTFTTRGVAIAGDNST